MIRSQYLQSFLRPYQSNPPQRNRSLKCPIDLLGTCGKSVGKRHFPHPICALSSKAYVSPFEHVPAPQTKILSWENGMVHFLTAECLHFSGLSSPTSFLMKVVMNPSLLLSHIGPRRSAATKEFCLLITETLLQDSSSVLQRKQN